ncbi:hypothetical protein RRG08_012531 [Elysia crispata]|uniref:Parathyroid hormone/parathyroid hormone-related peptide receptor n=1 Tax=Elysia crispata TaxID=231223 RepID=A0AAE1AP79_9GAST|nr:hypothetical protein RRG08_012531 [Elysia crispata]
MATHPVETESRVLVYRRGFHSPSDVAQGGARLSVLADTPPCSPSDHQASSSPPSPPSPSSPINSHSEKGALWLASSTSSVSRQPGLPRIVPIPVSPSSSYTRAEDHAYSNETNIKKPLVSTATDLSHLSPLSGKIVFSDGSKLRKRKKHRRNQHRATSVSAIVSKSFNCNNTNYNTDSTFLTNLTTVVEKNKSNKNRGGLLFLLAMAALLGIGGGNERSHSVVNISADRQMAWLEQARIDCFEEIIRQPWPDDNVTVCPRTWDLVMCWPDTLPGEVATQPCPSYVNGFQPWENATRRCMEDGTWYLDVDLNRTWTNMSLCLSDLFIENGSEFVKSHMERIVLMYSLGYGLSLASLGLSLFIMLYFKRLHCPRNYIHLNLFVSFILRASISFMKEKLLVAGLGFPSDVEPDEFDENKFIFKNGSTHWQCKMFFTCFNYILGANYMWILAEGVYLQLLISRAVFSEKSSVKWYMLFGWLSPLTFVIPWVIVRIFEEDKYCWNTHPTVGYFWIMRGPIVLSILINFFFFLNIIRVLFTKLNAVNSPEARRFRKLARSTLVLIPLFGVHYMVFLVLPTKVNPTAELVQLYFEMFFNSTQGFFVAVLYCFVNGEVRNEIRKKWHRFSLMHLNHVASTRTNYSSTNTFASYLSRANEIGRRGSRLQDPSDHHQQPGREGKGRGKGSRGRLPREQESATMLLPLKYTASGASSFVKENGVSECVERVELSSNDILDHSDVYQWENSRW